MTLLFEDESARPIASTKPVPSAFLSLPVHVGAASVLLWLTFSPESLRFRTTSADHAGGSAASSTATSTTADLDCRKGVPSQRPIEIHRAKMAKPSPNCLQRRTLCSLRNLQRLRFMEALRPV